MKQTIDDRKVIAENLKKFRKSNGNLRQKEVAAALKIKPKRYEAWEQAKGEISATMILKLMQFYNLDSADKLLL